jgi:hypothetical protein
VVFPEFCPDHISPMPTMNAGAFTGMVADEVEYGK